MGVISRLSASGRLPIVNAKTAQSCICQPGSPSQDTSRFLVDATPGKVCSKNPLPRGHAGGRSQEPRCTKPPLLRNHGCSFCSPFKNPEKVHVNFDCPVDWAASWIAAVASASPLGGDDGTRILSRDRNELLPI